MIDKLTDKLFDNKKIILASSSPRRIEMMRNNGLDPTVIPADIDESAPLFSDMRVTPMTLSLEKALHVEKLITLHADDQITDDSCDKDGKNFLRDHLSVSGTGIATDPYGSETFIVAADTIVYKDGNILGKPKSPEEAETILMSLSGSHHYVVTGVAIIRCSASAADTSAAGSCTAGSDPKQSAGSYTCSGRKLTAFASVSKVYFKKYDREEIQDYIQSPEPYDKAGGYAIQGTFGKYVERFDGDINNIIGFPWDEFKEHFAAL